MRTVTSYLQLLQRKYEGRLGTEAEQYIEYITSAAGRMRQMVLDLLGYSQILRSEDKVERVSVESVLALTLLNLQMAIESTGAVITFDHLPTVMMDQTKLFQLLQNLIGNAIKYRSKEPPSIHLSAKEAGSEWIISIRDKAWALTRSMPIKSLQYSNACMARTILGQALA